MKKVLIVLIPIVILVGAHYGLTLLDEVLTVGRMWETPAVRPHEQPIPIMTENIVPVTGGEAVFRAAAGADLKSPLPNKSAGVAKGKNAYFLFCAQCHGKRHDGNGTVGQSFAPLPGDLRSPHIQSLPDGVIFKEISYGKPGGRQPPLATTIAIMDRWNIVAYLKSLGPRD